MTKDYYLPTLLSGVRYRFYHNRQWRKVHDTVCPRWIEHGSYYCTWASSKGIFRLQIKSKLELKTVLETIKKNCRTVEKSAALSWKKLCPGNRKDPNLYSIIYYVKECAGLINSHLINSCGTGFRHCSTKQIDEDLKLCFLFLWCNSHLCVW